MLELQTGPVEIVEYRSLTKRGTDELMKRRDGSPVEMCVYKVASEADTRETVLAPGINGSRPPVGARVHLLLDSKVVAEARAGADPQRPFVTYVTKYQVKGAQPVKA